MKPPSFCRPLLSIFIAGSFLLSTVPLISAEPLVSAPSMRPPAVPLMVHNSYFSVWAFSENLKDAEILNWTGTPNPMTCLLKVNGTTYRLMGDKGSPLPVLEQKSLVVDPTKTTYLFANTEVEVELSFLSPVLTNDLKLLARPVSFVGWKIRSLDGNTKTASLYFDVGSNITLIDGAEQAKFERVDSGKLDILRVGSLGQQALGYRGDVTPLNWGYCYLAVPVSERETSGFGPAAAMQEAFVQGKAAPASQAGPFRLCDERVSMAVSFNFGAVGAKPVERRVMVGYNSSPEIQYFSKQMESYWKNETTSFEQLLKNCWTDYPAVSTRCAAFDAQLKNDARKVGGEQYAELLSLLYRQVIGANHLTRDEAGNPVYFSRENASNSSINTVDVSFPASPFFLLHSRDLLKSMLVPIFDYASHPSWTHDSSPHSIGTFPHATGQRYGGGGSPMPVEETGNMLLITAAICKIENSPEFANRYSALLEKWGAHLAKNGYDTGEQLCTDDFRGRQLHNTNLSVKGICGLAAYAKILEMQGEKEKAATYAKQAKAWALQWEEEALAPEKTHFMQAFGQPNTWSFKYNMIWDKLLGLGLFSPETYRKEFSFYQSKLEKYGVPMDHRDKGTKFDWNVWAACFADQPAERDLLLKPLYKMVNESPTRLPLTDYFKTDTGTIVQFYARSVMGGVWMPMILDSQILKTWAAQNPSKVHTWAPQPPRLELVNIVPGGDWKRTFETPGPEWQKLGFDDSAWTSAPLPVSSPWPEGKQEVWLRKTFPKPTLAKGKIQINAVYQDEFEVFLNGRRIYGTEAGSCPKLGFRHLERILATSLTEADFAEQNVLAIRSLCPRKNPHLSFNLQEVRTVKLPNFVVPSGAESDKLSWRYTTENPGEGWFKPDFNAGAWKEGVAGFGSPGTPGGVIRTEWKTPDIWLRREIDLPTKDLQDLQAWFCHDEDAEVYINGALALKTTGYNIKYSAFALTPEGQKALRPGKNSVAIHCRQTNGGQYIDLGFVRCSEK